MLKRNGGVPHCRWAKDRRRHPFGSMRTRTDPLSEDSPHPFSSPDGHCRPSRVAVRTAVAAHADPASASAAARVLAARAADAAAWHGGARLCRLLSVCAASLAPLATLGSSDAVGAAESGLCFGVRLRPAIRSPGGGAGAFTDSSKVRSRHTSLNSHACILWGCYTHSHACCRSPTHSMAICVCSQELQGRFAKANIEYVILQGFLLPSFEACARVRTRFL